MTGVNQLPAGSEIAAAISLIWASSSWLCSGLLLWLTWSHHEGFSYLALLAMSSLLSTTCSIVQQGRDITWYQDMVIEQFARKQKLPANDPELAIAGGSFGADLVLYYIQYYSYNVQAMLVMFWAAELCQLTYQVGERRKIRRIFRRIHAAGKFIAWLLPLTTILSLRTPSLRQNFLAFILLADFPLMLSLAIGSCLLIAVTIRYVQSRQKFTQWSPPNFNSTTSGSEAGMGASPGGTQNSSRAATNNNAARRGLYDRWLMVRFTIAFVLLAVFEVTNTLFQVTTLDNNIHDSKASSPDLSAGRAMQTLFLYMPGTTPGIFLYIIFGTTASSQQKLMAVLGRILPQRWRGLPSKGPGGCFCSCFRRKSPGLPTTNAHAGGGGGKITIERSLTITSSNRFRGSGRLSDDELPDPTEIWMKDITRRPDSALSFNRMKPLPPAPAPSQGPPSSKFRTISARGPATGHWAQAADLAAVSPTSGRLTAIEEKSIMDGGSISRPTTGDSSRAPDDYHRLGPEHSDDSGPILPIQRHEVRFSMDILSPPRPAAAPRGRQSKNFSLPRI